MKARRLVEKIYLVTNSRFRCSNGCCFDENGIFYRLCANVVNGTNAKKGSFLRILLASDIDSLGCGAMAVLTEHNIYDEYSSSDMLIFCPYEYWANSNNKIKGNSFLIIISIKILLLILLQHVCIVVLHSL